MKRNVLYATVLMLFVGSFSSLSAQDSKNDGRTRMTAEERVERKVQRIAKELMLDDKTTAQFSEIYKEYIKDVREAMTGTNYRRMKTEDGQQRNALTDEQIDERIKARFARERKMLDIQEKYYEKYSKVLTPRQISKIYAMEQDHRKAMANKGHHAKGDRRRNQ